MSSASTSTTPGEHLKAATTRDPPPDGRGRQVWLHGLCWRKACFPDADGERISRGGLAVKQLLRKRPSPAMVVAVVAVVMASVGSATAATLITGKQIKNNSLT